MKTETPNIRDTSTRALSVACLLGEHEWTYYDMHGKEMYEPIEDPISIAVEMCHHCGKVK